MGDPTASGILLMAIVPTCIGPADARKCEIEIDFAKAVRSSQIASANRTREHKGIISARLLKIAHAKPEMSDCAT